mmetsp:Transcript_16448/g.23193  ORF Transcript_16448/g.23193 Transcript_16448/m.23193 type:complete len:576 (+) Transcript_16448:183-1910(+)
MSADEPEIAPGTSEASISEEIEVTAVKKAKIEQICAPEENTQRKKICIRNLPSHWDTKQVKKWLSGIEIDDYLKLTKIPRSSIAKVILSDSEKLNAYIERLNSEAIKNSKIEAFEADSSSRGKKSKAKNVSANVEAKKMDIVEVVTPLFESHTYAEQLRSKEEEIKTKCVRKLCNNLKRIYEKKLALIKRDTEIRPENAALVVPEWLKTFKTSLSIEILPIKPSPKTTEYRNKCEFTIGFNERGEKVVGFRLSKFAKGSVLVAETNKCPNVPVEINRVRETFQAFIRKSQLQIYDLPSHVGTWRQILLRKSEVTGEILACVTVSLKDADQNVWEEEQGKMVEHVKSEVSSLSIIEYEGLSCPEPDANVKTIMGKEFITDSILGVEFNISASSFFQVNTTGAEVLYNTIIDSANLSKDHTLLDICCGTGSIGLCCAKATNCKVYGIDIVESAIKDANANALRNEIGNAEFVCGKAEVLIEDLLRRVGRKNVVAVVDPPRSGLHSKVPRAIRENLHIKKVVYVSCNPTGSLIADVEMLCCPESKRYRGAPFEPKKVVPVDMFPHTSHIEVVMVLERQ